MKVVKLDRWNQKELYSRIGKSWYLWKACYDFAWIQAITNKTNLPSIFINENGSEFLIVQELMTPDCGLIPIIVLEGYIPYTWLDKLFTNQIFIEQCGFKVIDNSHYDMVIDLKSFNTFDNYYKQLSSQITRCWNKNIKETTFNVLHIPFFESYMLFALDKYTYWNTIKNDPTPYIGLDLITTQAYPPKAYSLIINQDMVAICWNYYDKFDIFWMNTYRSMDEKYTKYALGNYMLLKNIELAFIQNLYYFNMGISIYDYKAKWLANPIPIKGIRYL